MYYDVSEIQSFVNKSFVCKATNCKFYFDFQAAGEETLLLDKHVLFAIGQYSNIPAFWSSSGTYKDILLTMNT